MDDLAGKISELLGSEERQRQFGDFMSNLASGGKIGGFSEQASPPSEGGGLDLSGILSMLTGAGKGGQGAPPGGGNAPSGDSLFDADTLLKLGGILSSLGGSESPDAALLRSLGPYLSPKRRARLRDALRILQLMELWPKIKESGILSSLLGGDDE